MGKMRWMISNNEKSNDYNGKHLYEWTNLYKQTLINRMIEFINGFDSLYKRRVIMKLKFTMIVGMRKFFI